MSDHKIVNIPIERLRPFPGNPKDLLDTERVKLKNELKKYGVLKALSVWEKGKIFYVLDGNQRLELLQELHAEPGGGGFIDIPCEPIECKDMEEATKICLILIGQYGRLNEKKLRKFVVKAGYKDMNDAQMAMSFPELDGGWMNTAAASNGEGDTEKVDMAEMAKARIFKCPTDGTFGYYKNHKAKGVDKKDIWDEQQA